MPSESVALVAVVSFVILCVVFRLERVLSRFLLSVGILLLVAVAIMFAAGREDLAERLADYAYFSFVSGVLLLLVERVPWVQKKLAVKTSIKGWLHSLFYSVSSLVSGMLLLLIKRASRVWNKRALKPNSKGWLPYLFYGVLSIAILGPLLAPRYILSVDILFAPDMDFTPQLYGLQNVFNSSAPFYFVMQQLSRIIPWWVLQKIILFAVFFLAGLGMHRLCPTREVGKYFAGLLYVVNPFTYIRFVVGQWGLLLAYALVPFAIKAFINLLDDRSWHNAIKVAVLSTLVGMIMVQGYPLLFLTYVVILLVKLVRMRRQPALLKGMAKYVAGCAAMFIGLNLYWLVPAGVGDGGTVLGQIGAEDILLFAPTASLSWRVTFDVASMHGFWRDGLYLYAKDFLPYWFILPIFIIWLAVYGSILMRKDNDIGWLVKSFGVIGIMGFLLALGASYNVTRPLFEWLFYHLPYFSGFRDSQKFVLLLCLSYAYLGGLAVGALTAEFTRQKKKLLQTGLAVLAIFAFITPLLYAFPIFGLHGQVKATDYPPEWYEVNDYLNQDKGDFNVLFLPWHLYMDYHWLPNTDKRMANPAWKFFTKSVIAGDNIELGSVYSQSTNPISKYIEFLLARADEIDNLGELLAPLNVKYIILVHEVDHARYDFLRHQNDLRVELERQGLTLFKNEHPTARVYGVNSVVYVEGLHEYLELSNAQDVMEHLYILGNGPTDESSTRMHELSFVRKSPVKYQVAGTNQRYTVLTMPQNVSVEYWEYHGRQSMQNLGFMPAFESSPDGAQVVYTRFYHIYLPSYIVSLIALALVLGYYFYPASTKTTLLWKKKTSGKGKQSQ